MDFYSSLQGILKQIPKAHVARLSDIADALGDRAATVALPSALSRLYPRCVSAAKAVRVDGSVVLEEGVAVLREDGLEIDGFHVTDAETCLFKGFECKPILKELRRTQERTAKKVILKNSLKKPRKVVGLDLAYNGDRAIAAAVLMDAATFEIEKEIVVKVDVDFPYIPGYLAFRELPSLLIALKNLRARPDLLFVDGHGLLHPAGCGIASHIGVKMRLPTIGVGKSLLVGKVAKPSLGIGEASPVRLGGMVRGYALRSSISRRPIYISPGNRISVKTALNVTRELCRYRIPEPIRQSHMLAIKMKNK